MDHSPMLSTPTPETILRNGHISATGVPAFTTCKSAYLNPSLLQKVSSRYLLVVVRAKVLRSEDHLVESPRMQNARERLISTHATGFSRVPIPSTKMLTTSPPQRVKSSGG